jgi:hypothetical protein
MSHYKIAGENKDFSELKREEINVILRPYHKSIEVRAFCLCTPGKALPLHVSVSRNGNFFLRKSATKEDPHNKLCHHNSLTEPQAASMGYTPNAITKSTGDEEDQLFVSLVTPLKTGSAAATDQDDSIPYRFKTGINRIISNRMTDLGLLHLLWEKAGLHGITSYTAEKSIWPLVRGAATGIKPRCFKSLKQGLSDILLLPLHDETENQATRNNAKLREAHDKNRHVLFITQLTPGQVAELNFTEENTKGFDLKNFFGVKVALYDDRACSLLEQFNQRFHDELGYSKKGADIILFGVARPDQYNGNPYARIETMVAMPVAQKHIPFDSSYEWEFINELVRQQRNFVKPLRYEAEKDHQVFPDFVLLDCNPMHVIEVYGRTDEDYLKRKEEKRKIYAGEEYPYKCWEWEAATEKNLPSWLANHPLPQK